MIKEETTKEMTQEQINSKLERFSTTSEKIKYLQSIEPRIKATKPQTQRAYYEQLGNLMRKKGDLLKMAEYYEKAGIKDISKSIWEKQGDIDKLYHDYDSSINNYHKAGAKEKEKQEMRKKQVYQLENLLHITAVIGAFLCSSIFLSGRITGNTILDASFKTSNIIGALLFIVGFVASFFYFERRKNR
jgi:tetratricopeptide (TPR) repeat protein